ncbi:MAG: phosphorylcholine transferase LicD [Suipraeoptans sp.]
MNEYLNKHQQMAVLALRNLKDICDRYNIEFYLLAGSALGAVRHKGFIPWDDDIDIGLKYDDWHRLSEILSKELEDSNFTYIDNKVNSNYPRMFGKILYEGQNCIDIFLIAKWTSNVIRGNIHWQIRRTAVEFYKMSIKYKSVFKPNTSKYGKIRYFITHAIRRFFYLPTNLFCNTGDYIRLARWNEKYFESKKTGWYINLYSVYKMKKEMIKEEWVKNPISIEFEGMQYKTLGNIDEYLTHLYGDYMTPPPMKDRQGSHEELFN